MAIAHVQTVSTGTTSASSVTRSISVGSGTNRTLVAYVSWIDVGSTSTTVSSVVFNSSEAFTFRVRSKYTLGSDNITIEIWTLDNPSNASANVVATMSESCNYLSIGVSEYTGANNGTGTNTAAATGDSDNPTGSFTTASTDNKALWGTSGYVIGTCAPGGGETERLDANNSGVQDYGIWEEAAAAGTSSISLTADNASYWTLAGIELKATSTGVSGSLSKTLDDLTKSLAGTVAIDGDLAKTLDDLSKTLAGTVAVDGDLAKELEAFTLTAAGTVAGEITGSLDKTLDDLSKSIAGTVDVTGATDKTLDGLSVSLAGTVDVTGAASPTLADVTLSSAGEVTSGVTGSLDKTLDDLTRSIAGTVDIAGALAKTLDDFTLSAEGDTSLVGTLSAQLDGISYSLVGVVDIAGVLDKTLDGLGISASGVVGDIESFGVLDATLGDLAVSLAGAVNIVGVASPTLADVTSSAVGILMTGVLGHQEIQDSLIVKSLATNAGLIWIGKHSDDTVSQLTGFELAAGETVTFLWVDNLADIYVNQQVETDELCWIRLFV